MMIDYRASGCSLGVYIPINCAITACNECVERAVSVAKEDRIAKSQVETSVPSFADIKPPLRMLFSKAASSKLKPR